MGKNSRNRKKYSKQQRRQYALRSQPEETIYMENEEPKDKSPKFIMEGIESWIPASIEIPFPENEIRASDNFDIKNMCY